MLSLHNHIKHTKRPGVIQGRAERQHLEHQGQPLKN